MIKVDKVSAVSSSHPFASKVLLANSKTSSKVPKPPGNAIKISDFFLETAHKGYLNAILDKVSKKLRKNNE